MELTTKEVKVVSDYKENVLGIEPEDMNFSKW